MSNPVRIMLVLAVAVLGVVAPALAEGDKFLEMRKCVNRGYEDDGIPGNGVGGWSDEGVNDFFLWPALPTGKSLANAFPFDIIDPARNGGRSVLMLAGSRGSKDLPLAAEVGLDGASGRYMYLLMNTVLSVSVSNDPTPLIMTVTLRYAGGTSHEFPVREGVEIMPWWTGLRPACRPPVIAPVHVGQNLVARGGFRAAVWATRFENPSPQKPVSSVVFKSKGLSVPCVFAATLSDADYMKDAKALVSDAAEPPAGYFAAKQKAQADALYAAMKSSGFIEGVRSWTLLRPDLVAITVDNALTRDNGANSSTVAPFQQPSMWTITSNDDPAFAGGKSAVAVGRKAFERYNGQIGPIGNEFLYWNTFFVRLPSDMKRGCKYTMSVNGMAGFKQSIEVTFDDRSTISHAIKVNQVGYSLSGKDRFAYLGWWAGSMGAVDYTMYPDFEVIDATSGKAVMTGKVELREAADAPSGENVFQLDIGKLGAGRYWIHVPGLGRSESFRVGAEATEEAAFNCFRAFFHQRCGQELKAPWTETKKPACHIECWESGYLVGNPAYTPKPGEKKKSFHGGYHDAADFDHFTQHLQATAQTLMVYECNPKQFRDSQYNLPESGNGIPDVLDEACWAVRFWLENQRDDGSIPLGRANDQDAWEQNTRGVRQPFGILPPTTESSPTYAAVAAQLSVLMRPFDKPYADRLLDSARRAIDYAMREQIEPYPKGSQPNVVDYEVLAWAVAECYRATGERRFADKLSEYYSDSKKEPQGWRVAPLMLWPMVRSPHPVPKPVEARARELLMSKADEALKRTYESAYRLGTGKYTRAAAWGSATPGNFGDVLARAHALTGEPKYLNALALNYDFLFGVNPPGKTFVTGMGWNPPQRPEISRFHYFAYKAANPNEDALVNGPPPTLNATMTPGLTVYGLGPGLWYYPTYKDPGGAWPLMHCHRDIWGFGAETWSEFTIPQTIGPSAILTMYLATQDQAQVRSSQK